MALAKGKELKQLTGQVFVGVAALIGRAVERELQRRIEHHCREQVGEAAAEVLTHVGDLLLEQHNIGQLLPAHRKESEPELDLGGLFGLGPPGEPAEPLALQGLRLPAPAGPAAAGGRLVQRERTTRPPGR